MRLRGLSEDGGKLESDLSGTISNITSKYGKAVQIFDSSTQTFKSTKEVMEELAQVWGKLSDGERQIIGEGVAGKNRVA